jgi:hypothetical protein
MRLYPNPGDGTGTITLPKSLGAVTIELRDAAGRCVHRQRGMAPSIALDARIAPGAYIVLAQDREGQRWTARYIVR